MSAMARTSWSALFLLGLGTLAAAVVPPCVEEGVGYRDPAVLTVNGGIGVVDAAACQHECALSPICGLFTYWNSSGGCWLQAANLEPTPMGGAISGPKSCSATSSSIGTTTAAPSTSNVVALAVSDGETSETAEASETSGLKHDSLGYKSEQAVSGTIGNLAGQAKDMASQVTEQLGMEDTPWWGWAASSFGVAALAFLVLCCLCCCSGAKQVRRHKRASDLALEPSAVEEEAVQETVAPLMATPQLFAPPSYSFAGQSFSSQVPAYGAYGFAPQGASAPYVGLTPPVIPEPVLPPAQAMFPEAMFPRYA